MYDVTIVFCSLNSLMLLLLLDLLALLKGKSVGMKWESNVYNYGVLMLNQVWTIWKFGSQMSY